MTFKIGTSLCNNFKYMPLSLVLNNDLMNRIPYQVRSEHIVVQVIKNFIAKLRQNPDIYPIRYYKKNRRFRSNYKEQAVK
jgi:hypothetical protein